jgi:DNA polymerase III epsilon subunit-like protein
MIENILILDTETTGLSPEKGDIVIEIAAVLFNVKHKAILQSFSTLLPCIENPVEKINHISVAMTKCDYPFVDKNPDLDELLDNPVAPFVVFHPDSPITFFDIIIEMSNSAQACVAHNAKFDKSFIATLRCGKHLLEKPWICTKANFTWPVALQRLRLEDICIAMRVPYIHAHRALADCLLLSQCFQNVSDLQERLDKCTA